MGNKKRRASSARARRDTPNALLNDVVLQNVFKYLGFQDLKSCRHVGNKKWLTNSTRAWSSCTNIVFEDFDEVKIADYLNQAEIASYAKNYKFSHFDEKLDVLFASLGHSILQLEFKHAQFKTDDDFRKLVYRQCPNLEKLVFKSAYVERSAIAEFTEPLEWEKPQFAENPNLKYLEFTTFKLFVSWMELLSHFPNIQVFISKGRITGVCRAISLIRQHDPTKLKLNHMEVNMSHNHADEQFFRSILLDSNLSFEKIHFLTWHSKIVINEKPEILNLHAKCLKSLYISGQHMPADLSWHGPLYNLETIQISSCSVSVKIFNFIPNVKKIFLFFVNIKYCMESTDSNLKLNSCKELSIGSTDLQFFLNLCPNIEKLYINGIDNAKFSKICETWTKLVYLQVSFCVVDTVGILGFDPDSKDKDVVRKPNITNLKNLQDFQMSTTPIYNGMHRQRTNLISSGLIFKELSGLEKLKRFALFGYQLRGISPRIRKRLIAKYSG